MIALKITIMDKIAQKHIILSFIYVCTLRIVFGACQFPKRFINETKKKYEIILDSFYIMRMKWVT